MTPEERLTEMTRQRTKLEEAALEAGVKITKLEGEAEMSRIDLAHFGQLLREAVFTREAPESLLMTFLETFDLYDDAGTVREHMGKAA